MFNTFFKNKYVKLAIQIWIYPFMLKQMLQNVLRYVTFEYHINNNLGKTKVSIQGEHT